MRIMFPSSIHDSSIIAPEWQQEAAIAQNSGLETVILPTTDFFQGYDFEISDPHKLTLYHGWQLSSQQYENLSRKVNLFIDYKAYQQCHYFDLWFPVVESESPKSVSAPFVLAFEPQKLIALLETNFSPNSSLVIRSLVSSQKNKWHEACFIPEISQAPRVAQQFVIQQRLLGREDSPLIFREFVKIKKFTTEEQKKRYGRYLGHEWRVVILSGKVTELFWYWSEYDDCQEWFEKNKSSLSFPPKDWLDRLAEKIFSATANKWFVLDVAELEDGSWTVIEVGAGNVSAFPNPMKNSQQIFNIFSQFKDQT